MGFYSNKQGIWIRDGDLRQQPPRSWSQKVFITLGIKRFYMKDVNNSRNENKRKTENSSRGEQISLICIALYTLLGHGWNEHLMPKWGIIISKLLWLTNALLSVVCLWLNGCHHKVNYTVSAFIKVSTGVKNCLN